MLSTIAVAGLALVLLGLGQGLMRESSLWLALVPIAAGSWLLSITVQRVRRARRPPSAGGAASHEGLSGDSGRAHDG